jgi:hypothetical protein
VKEIGLLLGLTFVTCVAFASDFHAKDTTVNVASGSGELIIVGDKLTAIELQHLADPLLTDFSGLDPKLKFELDKSKTEHPSVNSAAWHFRVTATTAAIPGPQARQLSFSVAGQSYPIAITLISQKTDARTTGWSVEGPTTPWNISQLRAIDFVVVTIGANIKGVRLTHSSLIDSSPGKDICLPLNNLHICRNRMDDPRKCPETAPLEGSKTTLWLVVDDDFKENGNFTGSIQLDTEPLGDTKSIPLTIQQTDWKSQFVGGVLIGIGVLVAWFVLAYGRTRISRAQALLPATLLREKVASLLLMISRFPQPLLEKMAVTEEVLGDLASKLSESYLDAQNYLPPIMPSVTASSSIQWGGYQAFLQVLAQKVDSLEIIVNDGLVPAVAKFTAGMAGAALQSLQILVANIDALSGSLPQQDSALRASISNLFKNWNTQITAQALDQAQAQALSLSMLPPRPKTTVELRVQIQLLTTVFWLVWGALSLLLGITVLIIPSPGFGGAMDYVRCFFWGFGLPVAGQSLQQVTQSNFNSNFGVTLSR